MPVLIIATERHTNNLILATDLAALDPSQLVTDLVSSRFDLAGDVRDAEGDFGLWLRPRGNVRAGVEQLARRYRVVWNGEPVGLFDGGEGA